MNKRTKTKRNKQLLIDSIIDSSFVANGYHWTAKTFTPGLNFRQMKFGPSDIILIDAKVNYAVHLFAMLNSPNLALQFLEAAFKDNPTNIDVATELIECYLELDRIEEAKNLFEKIRNKTCSTKAIRELAEYIDGDKVWEKYTSSEIAKIVIDHIELREFDLCKTILNNKNDLESELLRLALYGAENSHEKFMAQLKGIVHAFNGIVRNYIFWYFRTVKSDSDAEYWELCSHPSFSNDGVILQSK